MLLLPATTFDVPGWLSVLLTLVGLAIAFGVVVVAFRGSFNKARLEALREDLQDAKNREDQHDKDMADLISRHDREVSELQHRCSSLESEVKSLRNQNDYLKELALQKAAVDDLMTRVGELASAVGKVVAVVASHHRDAMQGLDDVKKLIGENER